jgi:TRAP-type C4-dicarboxylate transport system permease small subunit
MSSEHGLVPPRQRHLKWDWLDPLERVLMVLCGLTLFAFSMSVVLDIITRTIGRPWLWLQEVTSTFFVYGIFIGAAAATRRNDHLCLTALAEALQGRSRTFVEVVIRLVILAVSLSMVYFGYINFLRGFGSFRMPSLTPIASLYAAIPISGALMALFAVEQLVNGLRNGFDHAADPFEEHGHGATEAPATPVPAATRGAV